MTYTVLYLPIYGEPEPGDKLMSIDGKIVEVLNEYDPRMKGLRKCDLHLVYYEYNQQKVLGRVSPGAKWVKLGMQFADHQVRPVINTSDTFEVMCQCGEFH